MNNREPVLEDFDMDRMRARRGKVFQRSRTLSIFIALLLVAVVGVADYFSGYQIYWSIFYLVAICFALWNVGVLFALLISLLSIASWLLGDWIAGVVYPDRFVAIWNTLITLGSYLVVVWLLSRLKLSHQLLDTRIRQRTAALREEMERRTAVGDNSVGK